MYESGLLQGDIKIIPDRLEQASLAAAATSVAGTSRRASAALCEFAKRYRQDIWLSAATLLLLAGYVYAIWQVH